jgi:hypothetical protein
LSLQRPVTYRGDVLREAVSDVAGPGEVVIMSNDPAAVVQLRDGSGSVRGTGVETLKTEMAPGSYTAIAIGLDGAEQHQPADLSAGQRTSVMLGGDATEGWPFRPGPLAWASPAAWVAGAEPRFWPAHPDGSGIVVLAVDAYQDRTIVPSSVTLTPVRLGNRSVVSAYLQRSAPDRALVDVQDVRLDVPVLRDTVTSIVVSGERVSVGLFDIALLDNPRRIVELDRAQNLLGAGRSGPAGVLLEQVRQRSSSRVADVLFDGTSPSVAPSALAAGTSVSVAHELLGGTPWAVFISSPA